MPLDRSQNRKTVLGAVFIITVTAVAIVVFFLGDIIQMAQSNIELIALVPDASALDHGSAVWIAGREVGTVQEIRFRGAQTDSSERLALVLRIPRKYASEIRQDAVVRIASAMVMGNPVVDIQPGSPTAPPVHDEDTLRVTPRGTLQGVMDRAMALTASFERMIADTRSFQLSARNGSARLSQLQDNLAAVGGSFREFSASMRHSPMRMLSDPHTRAILADVSRNNAALRKLLRDAQERSRNSHTEMQPALKQLMARSDTISRTIAALRAQMTENGGGLLVRAQKDSAIVKALHEASVQLDSLMAETRRNPLRFWF